MGQFKQKINDAISLYKKKQKAVLEAPRESRHKDLYISTVLDYLYLIKELATAPKDIVNTLHGVSNDTLDRDNKLASYNLTYFLSNLLTTKRKNRLRTYITYRFGRCSARQHNALLEVTRLLNAPIIALYLDNLSIENVSVGYPAYLTGDNNRILRHRLTANTDKIAMAYRYNLREEISDIYTKMYVAKVLYGYDSSVSLTTFLHKKFIEEVSS